MFFICILVYFYPYLSINRYRKFYPYTSVKKHESYTRGLLMILAPCFLMFVLPKKCNESSDSFHDHSNDLRPTVTTDQASVLCKRIVYFYTSIQI